MPRITEDKDPGKVEKEGTHRIGGRIKVGKTYVSGEVKEGKLRYRRQKRHRKRRRVRNIKLIMKGPHNFYPLT